MGSAKAAKLLASKDEGCRTARRLLMATEVLAMATGQVATAMKGVAIATERLATTTRPRFDFQFFLLLNSRTRRKLASLNDSGEFIHESTDSASKPSLLASSLAGHDQARKLVRVNELTREFDNHDHKFKNNELLPTP